MNNVQPNPLRQLTLADFDRSTLVISPAFRDDPLWGYLFHDRHTRAAALPLKLWAFYRPIQDKETT